MIEESRETKTPSSSPPSLREGEKKGGGSLNKSEMVSIAFQLGFIIAIPVVVFGYFGKWLDAKLDSYPLLTLIGILTAIVFTSVWIYRKFKSYFNSIPSSSSSPRFGEAGPSHGGEKREGNNDS